MVKEITVKRMGKKKSLIILFIGSLLFFLGVLYLRAGYDPRGGLYIFAAAVTFIVVGLFRFYEGESKIVLSENSFSIIKNGRVICRGDRRSVEDVDVDSLRAEVNIWDASLAIINYRDGSSFSFGFYPFKYFQLKEFKDLVKISGQ